MTTLIIFCLVYAGMVLGRYPGLALDRTGIVLLGAIALLAVGSISEARAVAAVDVPTIGLLFGMMVLSAQFRLGGFYTAVTRRIAALDVGPPVLLLLLTLTAGLLSALLANDIVCLAMAPIIIEACARRGLRPVPFLLALACGANVGSAATLIGNPQNMLIGQTLHLSFGGYLRDAAAPAALGLLVTWWVIRRQVGDGWHEEVPQPEIHAPPFNAWQSAKGLAILAGLTGVFLLGTVPREMAALCAAGVILMSRRMHSHRMLALVDWQLLVLFIGLFILNQALADAGTPATAVRLAARHGVALEHPAWLFAATVVLSNIVSNVPAVMLLLPVATHPKAGALLALSSTLAGNLFIVGSIANIIVVDQAQRHGIRITWRAHLRVGLPVTVLTLLLAAAFLALSGIR
jgi:Na+/H+ antiporter NhaD/arsenite permease-like protein